MKKLLVLILLAATLLTLCACGEKKAECKIVSADFAENIPVDGVFYTFEEYDIFKIVFSATFAEKFDGDGAKGDDFRKAMYAHLKDGCKLTCDGEAAKLEYGYWPKKASGNSATEMTLFYTVPKGAQASSLEFTFDGAVLGDAGYQFSYKP